MISYYLSQCNSQGKLLIGTGNRDEIVTGYYTKYDCSSGDVAPIADLSKSQVRMLVRYLLSDEIDLAEELESAKPSAKLSAGQTDENELGMTYEEISACSHELVDLNQLPSNRDFVERFKNNRHKAKILPPFCQLHVRNWSQVSPIL